MNYRINNREAVNFGPGTLEVTGGSTINYRFTNSGPAEGTKAVDATLTIGAGQVARVWSQGTFSDVDFVETVVASATVDADAGTGSLRTLGTGSSQAAAGDDARFSSVAANTKTADYTLVLADAGKSVEENSGSATVITIPPDVLPVGAVVELCRIGSGSVTITPGSGVTIPNRVQAAGTSSRTIANQWSSASIRQRATNVWVLVGDIA